MCVDREDDFRNDPLDTDQILESINELREIVVSLETIILEDRKANKVKIWNKHGTQ